MPGLRKLNEMSAREAEAALLPCCGSAAWARAMADARPFADRAALLAAADRAWWSLTPNDWLEAFRAHPRIGERTDGKDGRAAAWSGEEQRGALRAEEHVRAEIAAGNRVYERRFGHVFLICASGLTAQQMLQSLRARLGNEPAQELGVAAEEQRRITHLRLDRLIGS